MVSIEARTGRKEIASLTLGWTITKFKEKMDTFKPGENGIQLKTLQVGETKWNFKLYPNGNSEGTKGHVSLFCHSENETAMLAEVSFTLKELKLPLSHVFTRTFSQNGGFGYDTFLTHSDINQKKYLKNGELQLVLKITVHGDVETTFKREVCNNLDSIKMVEKTTLGEDFQECWVDDEFSDVKIKCGGIVFYCHRIVLARRSNYFSTMLKGSFKESQSGVIDMANMDAETFKAVLKYIYEGEIDGLETNAMDLLEASERFELDNLKNICEEFLIGSYMKLENAIDTLLMADLYKAKRLKEAAMEIIVANNNEIIKQEGWKVKLRRSGHLIFEIFEAIGAQK